MKVNEILSYLRNCTVNFKYCSNESDIGTADVFFYGSGLSINFYELHIDKTELLSLTVQDIYAIGSNSFRIYVS